MPGPTRSKRSSSAKSRKVAPKKRRSPKRKASSNKRSAAAKKGWQQRRKKERLIEAIAAKQWKQIEAMDDAQPIGWIQRRESLRAINGDVWRQIAIEFSKTAYEARRLAALEELKIDLLTRDDLYDYLLWYSEKFNVEISDAYRMYLGYSVGAMTDDEMAEDEMID